MSPPPPQPSLSGSCAARLQSELDWLSEWIAARLSAYLAPETQAHFPAPPQAPTAAPTRYDELIESLALGLDERLLIALALAPSVRPALLDVLRLNNPSTGSHFTEFGGHKGTSFSGFLPTGETALFVLAGDRLDKRFELLHLFEPEHILYSANILKFQRAGELEPPWSAPLSIASTFLRSLISGEEQKPDYSLHFPAKRISSPLAWEDLVLDAPIMDAVQEIRAWAQHGPTLLEAWGLKKHLAPGFRALFHGPPGTGKTLTACLLGREQGVDVYRIDLSQVVSKYIGETEKNLASVFDQAANKNWILFFDEADALFGKRTQTSSSHDRYANQEVSFLLQRLETYPGIVLLATNFKANLDDAFARRLQASIYFAPPDFAQRLKLWQNIFPLSTAFEEDVDLRHIAREYKLTGGQIVNVVRHACLMAIQRGAPCRIRLQDLLRGIHREQEKEGRAG